MPAFDDYAMKERTYKYFTGAPLYPFGHGLSYTSFGYANLRLNRAEIGVHETVTVQFDITNSGDVAGDEVAQLYVTDIESTVVRPQLDLRGFQRLKLDPGQTATVSFELAAAQLGFHSDEVGYVVEPGDFRIRVGRSSADLPLEVTLTIAGEGRPVPTAKAFLSRAWVG
jgi:beta-glucosidase